MTASEAIEICRLKAENLNVPWSSDNAIAKRRRVWPFPAFWRVVSHVKSDNATVTMNVHERTRKARPIRALWAVDEPARVQPWLVFLFAIKAITIGTLLWLFARYMKGWPIWGATLFALLLAYPLVMGYEMIVARIQMREDEEDDTDAT